jgi:hypothetical protein
MREQHTAADAPRVAYHAAFDELDLSCQWDPEVHGAGRDGLRAYLEREHAHLLRVYDADFVMDAVEATRARLHRAL